MKSINLLLSLFILLPLIGLAQTEKPSNWCGSEYPADMIPHLERASQDIVNGNFRTGGDYTLPLTIHVLHNTNGSGGVSEASVFDVFCGTSEKFDEYGIDLYLREIKHINNSNFNSNPGSDGTLDLLYSVNGTVNIFVHSAVSGQDLCGVYKGSATGQVSTGAPDLIQVSSVCWGASTLIHELGHYFGLPHTFFGFEGSGLNCNTQSNSGERMDGSNCTTKGDRICDTPPDYSSDRWNCSSTNTFYEYPSNDCNFSQTSDTYMVGCNQTDFNGCTFRPDGTNYMSYSDDDCVSKFSPMQVQVMKTLIDNLRQDLYNFTPPAQLGDITGTVSPYLPANGASVPYDEVWIGWSPNGAAASYLLEINRVPSFAPTFIVESVVTTTNGYTTYALQPNQNYYWRVKPYNPGFTCAPYSDTGNFSTLDWTVSNEDVEGLESFRVSPNPAVSGQSVSIELQSDRMMDGILNLYNVQGQLVYTQDISLTASTNQFMLETQRLPAGMYVVNIDFEKGSIQEKLIIGK